jgi:hypothetical protein
MSDETVGFLVASARQVRAFLFAQVRAEVKHVVQDVAGLEVSRAAGEVDVPR